MDDSRIISDFSELQEGINSKRMEMMRLYYSSDAVKEYVELLESVEELEKLKAKLEPSYYGFIMRSCNHVFAECSQRLYEFEFGNSGATDYSIYNLEVDHYCLKCGLSTAKLYPSHLSLFGIEESSTAKVPRHDQLAIIKDAKDYSIIDFGEFDICTLIGLWNEITIANSKMSLDERINILRSRILEVSSKNKPDPKRLLRSRKKSEYRFISKK